MLPEEPSLISLFGLKLNLEQTYLFSDKESILKLSQSMFPLTFLHFVGCDVAAKHSHLKHI